MKKIPWIAVIIVVGCLALLTGYFSIAPDLRPSLSFQSSKNKTIDPVFAANSRDFMRAVQDGDNEKLSALLSRNPGLINSKRDDSQTPLILAVVNGKKATAEFLIARGADVNGKDSNGWTPLMRSVTVCKEHDGKGLKGSSDMSELLIKNGASLDEHRNDGLTALMLAAINGDEDMVSLLISHGADVNAKELWGYSALSFAEKNNRTGVVSILRRKGAR